jgi:TRAP-type C4-dicarboxylate transport system substrate-binding protein
MGREKKAAMKKFLLISFSVVMTGGILIGGLSQTAYNQQAPIKLTYALFQPATAALSVKNTEFAKEIEKRTNGRVQIQVFQSGSLLGAPAMYQGVRTGIADMGNCLTVYNPGVFPFTRIAEMPAAAQSGWAVSNAIYDFLMKYQPKEWNDVHLLTTCGDGFNIGAIAMGKVPILKLEDWKGKSVRPVHADVITALGGTVKDLPMAEVYDAISKGVLDGEVGAAEPLKSWRLADVAKHITLNFAPAQPSIVWYNIMNKDKWNSLPPDIQKTITEVGKEYCGKLGLTWDEQEVAGVEYAKSVGSKIYVLSKEEEARWQAAIATVIETRMKDLTAKGFARQELEDAFNYFKSRLAYWNGQQSKNNISPLMVRLPQVIK